MITELFFFVAMLSPPFVEPWWRHLCANHSFYAMFVGGCFLSQVLAYFLACVPFILFDRIRPAFLSPRKIQPAQYPTVQQIFEATRDVLLSFIFVILPMLAVGGFVLPSLGITRDGPLPPSHLILLQIIYFFLVEDFLNYWFHRALHTPWLYRHVHSVHHMYHSPFSLTAAHAHPVETIVLAIPTFVGPLALSPHLYTLMLWQLFRNFEAIDIHSGYDLPYSFKSLFPAYAGPSHHDYHHYMHSGNFASVFTWCDLLYGTDLGYRNYRARRKIA